jgi:hypothetical protein
VEDATELAGHLSQALGQEKALAEVQAAARELGLSPLGVRRQDALAILDRIAGAPGIVGITARFAKSRLHLKWASGE